MIVGVLGNVTVIIYTIFLNKEKTATTYLTGNLALADLLVCLLNSFSIIIPPATIMRCRSSHAISMAI